MPIVMRIVKDSHVLRELDSKQHFALIQDILTALLKGDINYTAYGEYDIINKAHFYIYDDISHWVIELAESDIEEIHRICDDLSR